MITFPDIVKKFGDAKIFEYKEGSNKLRINLTNPKTGFIIPAKFENRTQFYLLKDVEFIIERFLFYKKDLCDGKYSPIWYKVKLDYISFRKDYEVENIPISSKSKDPNETLQKILEIVQESSISNNSEGSDKTLQKILKIVQRNQYLISLLYTEYTKNDLEIDE